MHPKPQDQPAHDDDGVLHAFAVDHVMRLTGLSKRQLVYWDQTGFFSPHFTGALRQGRIYSFRDLVGLRTLAILRKDHGVSLPHLRDVARSLAEKTASPWSDLRLAIAGRRVKIIDAANGNAFDALDGQYSLLPLGDVRDDVRHAAERLRQRGTDEIGHLVALRRAPPTFAGTRIPVSVILAYVDDGFSRKDILSDFPTLTDADISAALQHRENEAA